MTSQWEWLQRSGHIGVLHITLEGLFESSTLICLCTNQYQSLYIYIHLNLESVQPYIQGYCASVVPCFCDLSIHCLGIPMVFKYRLGSHTVEIRYMVLTNFILIGHLFVKTITS